MVPTDAHRGPTGQRRRTPAERQTAAETRCIPLGDRQFEDAVRSMIDEIRARGRIEARALERRLRRQYPKARVVARQVIAATGGEIRWYAFRDGTRPPAPLDFE